MVSDLVKNGLERIGRYAFGRFDLDSAWEPRCGVYVWVCEVNGHPTPVRIGIACGKGGFGNRFKLHNKWLEGRFKPHDVREQAIRRLTLEGLGDHAEVWGRLIDSEEQAKSLECSLRKTWTPSLTLDLEAPGSWIKRELDKLREGWGKATGAKSVEARMQKQRKGSASTGRAKRYHKLEDRLIDCDSWVQQAFRKLETMCCKAARDIHSSDDSKNEGRKFYVDGGRGPFCRIDPKQHHIGMGFHKGIRSDVDRTGKLRRGRSDLAWIFVNEDDDLGPIADLIGKAIRAARLSLR